jgi:hypothetical protein
VKDWQIIADNLHNPNGAWAGFQLWIVTTEQSELLTPTATETVSLCVQMEN